MWNMRTNQEMRTDNNPDKKYSSKLYRFFDLLYKLLVINISMIILSLPIITMFPVIVAATATLKNNLNQYDLEKVQKVLNEYGFDLNVRAEQLSIDIFIEISNNL